MRLLWILGARKVKEGEEEGFAAAGHGKGGLHGCMRGSDMSASPSQKTSEAHENIKYNEYWKNGWEIDVIMMTDSHK